MATGWPLEARLALLHECWLAAGHEPRVAEADGARENWYFLSKAILDDVTTEASTRQRLYAQLKKTAVWPKVIPFLTNGDKKCATCGHSKYHHGGYGSSAGTQPCNHGVYNYVNGHTTVTNPCVCTQFIVKPMK